MKRIVVLASLVMALAVSSSAGAASRALSNDENARLNAGETVARSSTFDDGDAHYVGGVTYTVLDASLAEITPLFDDERAYAEVLPRTKSAAVELDGNVRHVTMHTGNSVVDSAYTLFLKKESAREFRFWLDKALPHDLDDAYGYFRFTELAPGMDGHARTLLTYAIAIDVGSGIVREFFEERVRSASLSVPQLLVTRLARLARERSVETRVASRTR